MDLGTSVPGNSRMLTSTQLYSAVAFIGAPGTTASVAMNEDVPGQYRLEQNYPNPFNPTTVISYELQLVSNVKLEICDMLGRSVATLAGGVEQPGVHSVRFDGSGLASGVYFYRIEAAGSRRQKDC